MMTWTIDGIERLSLLLFSLRLDLLNYFSSSKLSIHSFPRLFPFFFFFHRKLSCGIICTFIFVCSGNFWLMFAVHCPVIFIFFLIKSTGWFCLLFQCLNYAILYVTKCGLSFRVTGEFVSQWKQIRVLHNCVLHLKFPVEFVYRHN